MNWIRVEDALPEPGETVLVAANGYHWLARWYEDRRWVSHYDSEYWRTPTHWMPLPELPQGSDVEE